MFMSEPSATGHPSHRAGGGEPSRPETHRGGGGSLVDPAVVVRALWRAKGLILLVAVLGAALAAAYAMTLPKIYAATTQILVDPRDIKVIQNEVTPNGLPSEATLALVESQIAVIYSNDLLARAVAEEGLTTDPEYTGETGLTLADVVASVSRAVFGETPRAGDDARRRELMTVEALRRNLSVSRDPNSFILNLTVKSRSPERAAQISGTIADLFIDNLATVQSDTARRASESLSSRLSELRSRVVDAERAVEAYKAENALIGVGGRLVDDDYILRINDQLARARADITALRVRAESMKTASVDDVVQGTFPEELTSEALTRLRSTYSQLEQEGAVLRARLGPRHPQRIASDEAVGSARRAIEAELRRIVAAAQTELQRASRTEEELTAQIDALKAKQVTTSGSFVRLRELEREVEASRAVYEAFLLRARETGEQEMINTANVRIISEAVPPLDPVSVSRKIVVAAGGIGGALAAATLVACLAVLRALQAPGPRSAAPVPPVPPRSRWEAPETAAAERESAAEPPAAALPARRDIGFSAPSLADSSEAFFRQVDAAGDLRPSVDAGPPEPARTQAATQGSALPPVAEPSAPGAGQGAITREAPSAPVPEGASLGAGTAERRRSLREAIQGLGRDRRAVPPAETLDAEFREIKTEIDAVKREIALVRARRAGLPV